jgi:hypothetical protein
MVNHYLTVMPANSHATISRSGLPPGRPLSSRKNPMRFQAPLRVSVTRHGDKEQKLKDFILAYLSNARTCAGQDRLTHLQLVARSADSPVVRAITGLMVDIATAGFGVRMILSQLDPEAPPEGWCNDGGAVTFDYEIRWARRPRLIEAHEQLVLGPQTCWIGDSMRRDPARCDAFENFVEGCGEAAGCAIVSFERLWAASQQILIGSPCPPDRVGPEAMPDSIAKRDLTPQTIAATRH